MYSKTNTDLGSVCESNTEVRIVYESNTEWILEEAHCDTPTCMRASFSCDLLVSLQLNEWFVCACVKTLKGLELACSSQLVPNQTDRQRADRLHSPS